MLKFKTNDTVIIMAGKNKGQKGKVDKILKQSLSLIVGGLNIYKKHVKPQGKGQKGGIVEKSRPLPMAKVKLVCPKCSKPTRVGFKITKDKKWRICKKCNQIIS